MPGGCCPALSRGVPSSQMVSGTGRGAPIPPWCPVGTGVPRAVPRCRGSCQHRGLKSAGKLLAQLGKGAECFPEPSRLYFWLARRSQGQQRGRARSQDRVAASPAAEHGPVPAPAGAGAGEPCAARKSQPCPPFPVPRPGKPRDSDVPKPGGTGAPPARPRRGCEGTPSTRPAPLPLSPGAPRPCQQPDSSIVS